VSGSGLVPMDSARQLRAGHELEVGPLGAIGSSLLQTPPHERRESGKDFRCGESACLSSSATGTPRQTRPPVIVLVEDQSEILSSLKRLLRREPYHCLSTQDPKLVLRWVSEGRIDLVMTDYQMETMSGLELLAKVRELSPSTLRFMLTSCSAIPLGLDTARRNPVQLLVQKPWDPQALRNLLRQALLLGSTPETVDETLIGPSSSSQPMDEGLNRSKESPICAF